MGGPPFPRAPHTMLILEPAVSPRTSTVDASDFDPVDPRRAPSPVLVRALGALDRGDRASEAGDRAKALECYGSALNDYLQEGLPVLAAHVAQRMIQRYPDVVRARMTLAVLSLAEGLRVLSPGVLRSSRIDFEVYVRAARAAGQEEIAIRQLHRFAAVTEHPAVQELAAEFLQLLGDRQGAERVFLTAYEEREGIRPTRSLGGDQRGRWIGVLVSP